MNIIVLNCYSRNSLAVVNALDSSYRLIGGAVARLKTTRAQDRWLKHHRLSEIFRHADPSKEPDEFERDIIEACQHYQADAIIATGTEMSNRLSYIKPSIEASTTTRVLIEDFEKLNRLSDKWHCYQLCQSLDIPMPRTILGASQNDMATVCETFNFPVIAKPRNSFASKGLRIFKSPDELKASIKAGIPPRFSDASYIFQEMVYGELHDVTSCSVNGRVVSMLTQKRVATLYDFGGGGIINLTTDDKSLKAYAGRIISYLQWNGILEFDFIKDGRESYLLECNPKIWGTTALTVAAGLNMPQQLIDYFVLKQPIKSLDKYEINLQYKWLFPECLYHWLTSPRTPGAIWRRIKKTLGSNGAAQTLHNLNRRDLPHLFGIVLNKSSLS